MARGLRQCSRTVPVSVRVDADLIAASPFVNYFSEQLELVDGQVRHKPRRYSPFQYRSAPCARPPRGIVTKQRFGCALGQIKYLAGKNMAFGGLAVPELSPVI